MPYLRLIFLLLLLCIGLPSQAQVRRCVGSDGTTVFTDRRCNDIGAVERPARSATGSGARVYRNACPRNLQDLMYELTTAIDSRDVNRLAGVYQWSGQSTSAGYAVMDRLQTIVNRPLADVVPIFRQDTNDPDDDYYARTTVRRAPIGLRLEQTLANGSTPSQTVLGLRHWLGCWWVSL